MAKKVGTLLVGLMLISVIATSNLSPADSDASQLARGKYLVERVGICSECHSPRNERGQFDRTRWLQGRRADFQPIDPIRTGLTPRLPSPACPGGPKRCNKGFGDGRSVERQAPAPAHANLSDVAQRRCGGCSLSQVSQEREQVGGPPPSSSMRRRAPLLYALPTLASWSESEQNPGSTGEMPGISG